MNDAFYEGPKEPIPQRQLRELPLSQRPEEVAASQAEISGKQVTEVFDALAFEINRATALIRAVEPRAKKLFVPVDRDAVNVRAAVRRRIEGSTGDQIPFDLYKDMLDLRVKTARQMKFEIVGELTGNVLADSVKIKKYLKTGGKGLSRWQEFLLSMEQFALWLLLNQLLGQFSCVEHQEVCAAKEPPGTEVGPTQLRHAIAIAAMMFILGMQEEHVMFAVKQPADALGIPPVDIINRARRLTKTDLHRELLEIVGGADPSAIIDYCNDYMANNPVGYEDWLAYRDLRHIREDAMITYYHAHQYSKEYSELLDFSSERLHQTPLPSGGGFLGMLGFRGRGTTIVNADADTISISRDHYDAIVNQVAGIDRGISSIAGVLTSGFSLDLLCCIGRFLGTEDVARLRRLRSVLSVARNLINNGISLSSVDPVNVLDFAVSGIQQALITFAERYFDKVAKDVLGWVGATKGDTWDDLFACPLIEDLLVNALGAIAKFRNKLFELVKQFTGRAFAMNDGIYNRWGSIYDARRLQTIISIIDRLIAEIERCARNRDSGDGNDPDPNPGENPTVYDDVPKPLILPPEVVQKFFANPNPVLREEGQRPIPPVGSIAKPGDPASTKNFRDICRGILPDELLDAVAKARA